MGYPMYDNCYNPHDYASKGVAGTGLGLGILGTALGVMNGGLGNFLGNGRSNLGAAAIAESQLVSQLQAENAGLRSEKYADNVAKETYQQTLRDNKALRDEVFAFVTPLAQESANNRVTIATIQTEQKCEKEKAELREQLVINKINEVALVTNNRFSCLDETIKTLSGRVDNVTKEVIPRSAICPEVMERFNSWVAPTATTTA